MKNHLFRPKLRAVIYVAMFVVFMSSAFYGRKFAVYDIRFIASLFGIIFAAAAFYFYNRALLNYLRGREPEKTSVSSPQESVDDITVMKAKQIDIKELQRIFDRALKPAGFKRRYSTWQLKGDELTAIINLQRSYYSRLYYVNFGHNINALESGLFIQIGHRLHSAPNSVTETAADLFDFENKIENEARRKGIEEVLNGYLIPKLLGIKTITDLRKEITDPALSLTVPQSIRDYINQKAVG